MADYVYGVKKFKNVADMMVINVSSPNTPGLSERVSSLVYESAVARWLSETYRLKLLVYATVSDYCTRP